MAVAATATTIHRVGVSAGSSGGGGADDLLGHGVGPSAMDGGAPAGSPFHEHERAGGADDDETDADGQPKRKFSHTTEAQRRAIIEWLEQARNYELLSGKPGTVTTAAGKRLKKADGLRMLTEHVNAVTGAGWTIHTTRSRYESMLVAFRKARKAIDSPDFAVTPQDRMRGIADEAQKRNTLYFLYDRLHALATTGRPLPGVAGAPLLTAPPAAAALPVPPKPEPELPAEDASRKRRGAPRRKAVEAAEAAGAPELQLPADAGAAVTSFLRDGGGATLELLEPQDALEPEAALALPPAPKRAKKRHSAPVDVEAFQAAAAARAGVVSVGPSTAESASSSSGASSGKELLELKQIEMETQKLVLQQLQLQFQTRELEHKEKQLEAQEAMRKQSLRADLTTKLVAAGKSLGEIKEYLALING